MLTPPGCELTRCCTNGGYCLGRGWIENQVCCIFSLTYARIQGGKDAGGHNKWQMAAGRWQVATGMLQVEAGRWQVASGSWHVVFGRWQLAGGRYHARWQVARLAGVSCLLVANMVSGSVLCISVCPCLCLCPLSVLNIIFFRTYCHFYYF